MDVTTILGVDPGSQANGYAVLRKNGQQLQALAYGVLRPKRGLKFAFKLKHISDELAAVIREYRPSVLSIEEAFFAANAKSALRLGEVRGAVMLTACMQGMDIFEYPATVIKQSITGYGRASKGQMQDMVKMLLRLDTTPESDAADAIAAAICHAWHL